MEQEIWKDIERYEGLYQVSNLGRIKRIKHEEIQKNGKRLMRKEIIKKQHIGKRGYWCVTLSDKYGGKRTNTVHRLMANAFIPNPENKPCIDHIDGIKTNNAISNLRWVSHKENLNNPTTKLNGWTGKARELRIKKIIDRRIASNGKFAPMTVYAYNLDGTLFRSFSSINEAGRFIGMSAKAIQRILNNKHKKAGGYVWSTIERNDFIYEHIPHKSHKPVIELDSDGNEIGRWSSVSLLHKEQSENISYSHFVKCVRFRKPVMGHLYVFA